MATATFAELQAELQLMGLPTTTEGQTAREWSVHWKCSIHIARNMIRACLKAELMTAARGLRADMSGRMCDVPVYLLTQQSRKKKPKQTKNKRMA